MLLHSNGIVEFLAKRLIDSMLNGFGMFPYIFY